MSAAKYSAVESFESRTVRIEEKLDGLDKRLSERCNGSVGRIDGIEKAVFRLGERIGKLEANGYRQEGGFIAVTKIFAVGAALGGLLVKLIEWVRGG